MELKGKALFNLLRINWLEEKSRNIKLWQVEDLQGVGIEELFFRLKSLRLILTEESFYLYAENCASPEELVDCIWIDEEDLEGRDRAYLVLFELWRRLLPNKFCLSIFCDQLDLLIELYDSGGQEEEEPLQKVLAILEDLLDENYDKERDAKKAFQHISSHCAHDLERFIFDYISDQITEKNTTYASELVDAFYPYVTERRRFDLLRARLFYISDLEESNIVYGRILEELRDAPNLELVLLVAESLIHHGDVHLFMQAVKQALPLLKKEEELQNLLAMVAEYYRCLDRDKEEKAIINLLDARAANPPEKSLDPTDQTLKNIFKL